RQAEAADRLAARHWRQPAPLLLLRAVRVDRVHREAALHRRHRAQTAVAALELLHDQPVGDVVEPRAPVALEVRAEVAELAHPRNQMSRELLPAVALLEHRKALPLDERAHA